jgi:hypothetical protein
MRFFREIMLLFGSLIGLILIFGAIGAGSGWIVERLAGPPRGYGAAALYGAAAGIVVAALVILSFRSPKGVEMAISAVVACVIAGLVGYRFLQSRALPGWKFSMAVFGGGFGGLALLLVLVMTPMVIANNMKSSDR